VWVENESDKLDEVDKSDDKSELADDDSEPDRSA
jgi:hypothetical protein